MKIEIGAKLRVCAIVALVCASALGLTSAHTRAATEGVTVVTLLQVNEGKDAAQAVEAMKVISDIISKQPGFIEGSLLQSSFPGNKPSHVNITKWRELKDWEALSASENFLKLLEEKSTLFSWNPAEVFTPVE